jgi:hypothetical protein
MRWLIATLFLIQLATASSSLNHRSDDDTDGSEEEEDDEEGEGVTLWRHYDQGDVAFAVTEALFGSLKASGFLEDLMAFPFIQVPVRNERQEEEAESISGLIGMLKDVLEDSSDQVNLESEIESHPFTRAWSTGITFMLSARINAPSGTFWGEEVARTFFDLQVNLFHEFWEAIDGNEDFFPSDFLVNHLLQGSSEDLIELGDNVSAMAERLSARIESDPHEERVREVYLFLSSKEKFNKEQVADACNGWIIPILAEYADELNVDSEEIAELRQLIPLETLKFCFESLTWTEKMDSLLPRMFTVFPRKFSVLFVSAKLQVDQLAPPTEQLKSVVGQLKSFSRAAMSKQDIPVSFKGSPALGPGPRNALLSSILPLAFDNSSLFETSDDRGVYLRPRMGANEGELRTIGRLIGLGLKHHVARIGARLTPAIFEYLRNPFGSMNNPTEFLEAENQDLASSLRNLRDTPDIIIGMEYPDNRVVESAEELESFIKAKGEFFILHSIKKEVHALLRGIYDVIPFGYLSWFTREEVETLVRGSLREINKEDLKRGFGLETTEPNGLVLLEWLHRFIDDTDGETLKEFLLFVSGSDQTPIQGFHSRDPSRRKWLEIQIDSGASVDGLPTASLCFLKLRLPLYNSEDVFRDKLLLAIKNCKSIDLS